MKNKYNKLRTATLIYLVIICVSWQYLLSKCIPGYRLEQDVRESLSSENPWAICMIQGLRGLPYAVDVSNSKFVFPESISMRFNISHFINGLTPIEATLFFNFNDFKGKR